jgi:hypothetical protein
MGQIYHFNSENDELLSEAEKAFDLSARRQSALKNMRELPETPHRPQVLQTLAGLFRPAAFPLVRTEAVLQDAGGNHGQ